MTMLIKSGSLHTMTPQGRMEGDILIRDGRIAAVAPFIGQEDASLCVLDAKGLWILPGLIDLHIRETPEMEHQLLAGDNSAGVTTGLLWPEAEQPCRLLRSEGDSACALHVICPEKHTDAQLHQRLIDLANEGFRCVCEIRNEQECSRMLRVVHSSGIRVVLAQLSGCEAMAEAIAMSGCPVVIGAGDWQRDDVWKFACRLRELGVAVAVTCHYPAFRLCHLPLCAALCAREGMDREEALQMITTVPAGILGLSDVGYIAEGYRADLVIYDGDPMLMATSHVMTIENGKIRH